MFKEMEWGKKIEGVIIDEKFVKFIVRRMMQRLWEKGWMDGIEEKEIDG